MEKEAQLAEDTEQVGTLIQSSPEDLAVDLDIEQPSQDPSLVILSDEGAEG